jgi:hypothetical protein
VQGQEIFVLPRPFVVGPVQNIFFIIRTVFQFLFPHCPCSKLGRQSCWVTYLLVCVQGVSQSTERREIRVKRLEDGEGGTREIYKKKDMNREMYSNKGRMVEAWGGGEEE